MTLPSFVVTATMAAAILLPGVASACSVCFGDPDSDLTKGLNAGVLALLLVVMVVLGGFAAFFVFIARRSSVASAVKSPAVEQQSMQ